MNPSADIAAPLAAPIAVEETQIAVPAGEQATKKPRGNFDSFVAKVRDISPEWLVNNGTRICLAFKASADGMSVWSSVRKGSQSPWRLAASGVTLGTEMLGMTYSEKKISEEQQEAYASMSKPRYFFTKTLEVFDPKKHIAETAGAATIMNGLFTTFSGLAQSSKRQFSWETLQGVSTLVAGLFMTYMPDRERAWQVSHMIFTGASPIRLKHSYDAYYKGFPDKNIAKGDWQQFAKWGLNQVANFIGTLYGGVKKLPDGSIEHIGKKGEDITAPRQSRRMVAAKDAPPHHPLSQEHPKTKVGQIDRQEMVVEGLEKAAEVA